VNVRGNRPTRSRCPRARQWISARLDGELSELERVLLATHLRRCVSCRGFAAAAGAVAHELRSRPLQHPRRAIAVPPPARRPRVRRAPAAGIAAMLGAAAIAGGVVLSTGSSAPGVTGFRQMPPPQSSLQVAIRDDQSQVEMKRFRYAVIRRPSTHWWTTLSSGRITSL
jgi:anti-sigma factor RsiW